MNENAKYENDVAEQKSGWKIFKKVMRFAVGALTGLFMGAVTDRIVSDVGGNKLSRAGAKAGGFLVGMMVSDQVGNYICDEVDEALDYLDQVKENMDEEE